MKPPVEGPASYWMTPEVSVQIATEISEARDVEVFFIGRRGMDGLIHEIESHAYGSTGAVPVLLNMVQPGEIIIHNHPSGDLTPSEADIEVSAAVGNVGAGSIIVSNDGERVRVIIRPHDPKKKTAIDPERVEELLGPGSELARELGEYEDRPQQRLMARSVASALNADGISVVEAGTGTGKSLAYLIPSILYALENEERILVSTNTINLQEQILNKDLPVVRRAIDRDFRAELVKGRSNYVCKRKAQFARDELAQPQQLLIEGDFTAELREVLEWAKQSETGDRADLNVPPREPVWERVVSEADNCLRVRCPHYESCFFYNSRRRAARASVLVVNHALLLSDLAVRRESNNWTAAAVLPPTSHVILDEAHHLEEAATKHLSSRVTRVAVRRLFGRLFRTDSKGRKGVLAKAVDKLDEFRGKNLISEDQPGYRALVTEIVPSATSVRDTVDMYLEEFGHFFCELARLEPPRRGIEHRVRLTVAHTRHDMWIDECEGRIAAMAKEIGLFADLNRQAMKALGDLDEDALKDFTNIGMEWRALVDRMDSLRRGALALLKESEHLCRWVELASDRRQQLVVRLCTAPVSVSEVLRETLHSRMKSEVLTSATLTVDGDFDFLFERTGVSLMSGVRPGEPVATLAERTVSQSNENQEPSEDHADGPVTPIARPLESLRLDTPFDYQRQVFFGVPGDLGDPRHSGFDENLATLVIRSVRASGGRAFVLFTSHGQMRRLHDMCRDEIEALGVSCLVQGQESRDRLLRRFRQDETSVLFATSSFWEGVDVRGRALELLIIARLPFAPPSDPITEAQYEYLRNKGDDPFSKLVVPRAIIRFKQGFGRLIRSRTDRGAVLIADDRVVRMNYGRRFLNSLPRMDIRHESTEDLTVELKNFFRDSREPAWKKPDFQ